MFVDKNNVSHFVCVTGGTQFSK